MNGAGSQKANLAFCKHPVLRTLPVPALLTEQDTGGSSGSKESSNSSSRLPHGSKSSTSPSQPRGSLSIVWGACLSAPAQKGEQSVGLCNIPRTKVQEDKAGKGPRRAGCGGDLQEAAVMLGCLLCSLLVQVPFRPDAAQGCAGEDWGSLRVFREGVLLSWTGTAAHSIVQTLSMHPKVSSLRPSCLVLRQPSGKQPLGAGRSLWASSGSLCDAPLHCQALLCIRRKWKEESILC